MDDPRALAGFEMDLRNLSILVVEDDPDARELMHSLLEQRGASVVSADCVASAFELLEQVHPNVIVSDIAKPDEDGFDLVGRLRALPPERGGRTPVVAVSAYSSNADRMRALAAGFDQYLHKPVDFDELFATIKALVRQSDPSAKATA